MPPELETIKAKVVEVLTCFEELVAIGMAGSQVLGVADKYSDLDLQAFARRVPPLDRRKEVYRQHEIETGPLDHLVTEGFENPPCSAHFVVDWLRFGGVKCDFLWLPCDEVDRLLSCLPEQPGQREALAVLAETVQPVFDPQGYVAGMKQQGLEYPEARARCKASDKFHYGHFFLCGWAVLLKCLFRQDVIAYHQAESEMIGVLIDALYAVNHTWQVDRRRVRFYAKDFHILPEAFLDRLESIVCRNGKHADLAVCHVELLSLFRDLAVDANRAHSGWQLPTDWQVNED